MPITSIPTQTEPSLGQSKSDTGAPYTAATDIKASIWNEMVARLIALFTEVGLTDGSTSGSLNQRVGVLEDNVGLVEDITPGVTDSNGWDDFTEYLGTRWTIQREAGSTVNIFGNMRSLELPGQGWAVMTVNDDPGGAVSAGINSRHSLVLDATTPLVLEWRMTIGDDLLNDPQNDECTWFVGLWDGLRSILLTCDDGTAQLSIFNGVTPTSTGVTLPTLVDGQTWTFRLVCTPTVVTLFAGIDDGALTSIGSITASIPSSEYFISASISQGGHAGERAMFIDYVRWSAARYASGVSFANPFAQAQYDLDNVINASLTALQWDDLPAYTSQTQRVVLSGVDTLSVIQDSFAKTTAPTINDDSADGYVVGSVWYDTTNDEAWTCLDATAAAAVWRRIDVGAIAPGVISAATYTVTRADHGKVFACEHASGCDITVPTTLPDGFECAFYGTLAPVTFNDTQATALIAPGLSAETTEVYSVGVIHVTDDTTTYQLSGDLLVDAANDPITDGDISQDGLLLREGGVGVYDAIKINRSATTDPGVGDDIADGYTVGSLWINVTLDRIYQCVDNTAGAAVWARLNRVSEEEYALFLGPNNHSGAATTASVLYWFDDFGTNTVSQYGSAVVGAGAAIAITTAAGNLSRGRVSVSTGTTATGSAWFRSTANYLYSSQIDRLVNEVVVDIGTLANATDDYVLHACGAGDVASSAFTFSYVRTQSANWQLVTWSGGTPTYTDSGIPVAVGTIRLRFEWDKVNVRFFINGTLNATVAYSTALNATYITIAQMISIASTVSKAITVDSALAFGRLLSAR